LKDEDFWKLTELAKGKDPGFDLYWMAIALKKVENFPDEINLWPVDMIKEVNPKEIKTLFSKLAIEIMERIKKGESHE
jgi:hypothetical protein